MGMWKSVLFAFFLLLSFWFSPYTFISRRNGRGIFAYNSGVVGKFIVEAEEGWASEQAQEKLLTTNERRKEQDLQTPNNKESETRYNFSAIDFGLLVEHQTDYLRRFRIYNRWRRAAAIEQTHGENLSLVSLRKRRSVDIPKTKKKAANT
ncbi:hypothetical protein F4782DRAFT_73932 [Xylaria castorea]|nr:hypothetical protein F4782DRAFT_73932 [Xylaria castorea]